MRLFDFKNKKVLIMGLGLNGGGVGSAEFFARLGSRVTVTDLKSRKDLAPSLAKLRRYRNITYHLGGHRPGDFRSADHVLKGPGVPENSPFLKMARRAGVPILSNIEIFFLSCPAPIIGITGTKGKSTTTWLLGQLLARGLKRRVWVGGNIRNSSVLDLVGRVKENDLVVLELASFQLDSLKASRKSPQAAIITNIFPDHLNRYSSMAAYAASKAGIFKFQKPGDYLFINAKDAVLNRIAAHARSRVIRFDPQKVLARYRKDIPAHVPDFHLPNIAAAVAVARHFGVGAAAVKKVLSRFRGIPDRMQYIRTLGGISFVNDTTATNPEAARQAVIATKRRIGRHGLHVIAGGYDKGLPLAGFTEALRRQARSVILLPGSATRKMEKALSRPRRRPAPRRYLNTLQYVSDADTRAVRMVRSMREAVTSAYKNAKRGDVVLLSPGAASFGLFQHEFDRGEQFVRAVRGLH